jgi:hypothetical protein
MADRVKSEREQLIEKIRETLPTDFTAREQDLLVEALRFSDFARIMYDQVRVTPWPR